MAEFQRNEDGLVVTGPLDVDAEGKLRRHLRVLLDGGAGTVTVDLSGVAYISSVCVGSLVAFWIDLRPAGRRLKVVPSPAVRKVLDMTGLSGVFARAASGKRKPREGGPRDKEPGARTAPESQHASFDEDAPPADPPAGNGA